MPSVLVADPIENELTQILEKAGIGVEYLPTISPSDLLSAIKGHEGLVVRSRTKVTRNVLDAADNLEIIGRAGVGVDNIDVPAATERGIAVVNAPYSNIDSVAEQVAQTTLYFCRPLHAFDREVKEGKWPKGSIPIRQLKGRAVGILGYGNVGGTVDEKLSGFGLKMFYHDPYTHRTPPYPHLSLEDLFARCDFVTVHTQGAEGIVTQELLERMPEGAVFINTARADVLKKGALEAALRNRPDLRAAIDVHEEEKAGPKALAEFGDRVLLTPHVAGSSEEAQIQAALDVGNQLVDYLEMGLASDFARGNTKVMFQHEAYPHLKTACTISRLISSWNGTPPVSLQVVPDRELGRYGDAVLRAAAIGYQRAMGHASTWLRTQPYENVTLGSGKGESPYRNFVVVTANPGVVEKEVTAVGSLNSEGIPTLRNLKEHSGDETNEYSVNQPMQGTLAFFVYEDGEGALEALSRTAKDMGLNIVRTSQIASGDRKYALCIFTIEGKNNYSVLSGLRSLDTTPRSGPRTLQMYHAFSARL